MSRQSNRNVQQGFIWLPREQTVGRDIQISSVSVLFDYIKAEFVRGVCPDTGYFKIDLINADGRFSNSYVGGETVMMYLDFGSGTTLRFRGKIDTIKNKFENYGQVLEIAGGHISSELLDIMVTAEYTGNKTCDEILKELVDNNLTGYTYVNVAASTVLPTIKWNNKPFWSCVEDLCNLAKDGSRFDAYVDDTFDFHFFEENSIENANEAIVWNDTLINLEGFGEQSTSTKNKITVYGDDGTGLPVIRVAQDSASQTTYGLKEEVITDTDVVSGNQADELASSTLSINKTPLREGKAKCFALPSIQPGDKIWITEPTMKVLEQRKAARYTHLFPDEQTEVILNRKREIPHLFRERILKDLTSEKIINPYKMTSSINMVFNDFSELSAWDSNIEVSSGNLLLSTGSAGVATSKTYTFDSDITQVHPLVVGEKLTSLIVRVSTNGGTTFEDVTIGSLSNVTAGQQVVLRVFINDADTQVDSIALLVK